MSDDALLSRIHTLHAAGVDGTKGGAGYPTELRQLVSEYARPLRAQGHTWKQIANQLPISTTTAATWVRQAEEAEQQSGATLVPVTIKEEHLDPVFVALLLTSPRGYQLSGLTLEQAAQLLGHLG